MTDDIQKQSEHDEILEALMSFNDPGIIVTLFRQLGWSYTLEIQETIKLAKQNANLSIKFKAIKHLRELLREAAETSGYVADVSSTSPNPQGGQTTFHAKRMAGFLSPAKQIKSVEIKEPEDDQTKGNQTIENRGRDRQESFGGTDTNSVFPSDADRPGETCNHQSDNGEQGEDSAESGGTEPADGGTHPECGLPGGDTGGIQESSVNPEGTSTSEGDNPCVKTRLPTCNHDLYPGISAGSNSEDGNPS